MKCFDPVDASNEKSAKAAADNSTKLSSSGIEIGKIDSKLKCEARKLSETMNIDELNALEVVNWFDRKGILKDEKRMCHYVRFFLSEKRYLVKLVTRLFKLRAEHDREDPEASGLSQLGKKYAIEILAHEEFFKDLMKYLESALTTPVQPMDDETISILNVKEVSEKHTHRPIFVYVANIFLDFSSFD